MRAIWCLLPLLPLAVLAGCATTEQPVELVDPGQARRGAPVMLERVQGQKGLNLGWIRTEAAGPEPDEGFAPTYEVIYDDDWRVVGYTTRAGRHYVPDGGKLRYIGSYSREEGLGQLFDQRPVDVSTEVLDRHQLAQSGPLTTDHSLTLTAGAEEEEFGE
jgi:hypothetical protein